MLTSIEQRLALTTVPSTVKVAEVLDEDAQFTYATLSKGKLQDNFIEIPNNIQLLTDSTVIKSIYVRESYKAVTALISDAMIKENVKKIVVTGTPGIGKTIYLHYFLWVLITKQSNINDQVERKIYFQGDSGSIFYFDGNKTVYIPKAIAQATVLNDKNCILLVDMVEEIEPAKCKGTIIIFSSPNDARYKQFMNGISRKFILNGWTLDELKAVWSHSYHHIQWKEVQRVYNKMGGVIRYVLEQNNVADEIMDDGISKARNMFTEMSLSISTQIASSKQGALIYRVVHYYSPDHSRVNSSIVFASEYALKVCLEGLKRQEEDRVLAFLKNNSAKSAQGYRGNLFEPYICT
eukprot:CAMPEP_0196764974 /NCGR_PEP_ID=MMETSP1095-20130614/7311_1 /TAXON_ID=96789 ORGANISM="Chromulina nebulosa, Strain UTEXLB2642" /NCGR_SAMPLE_ID=MMETSP1095 /ASSEMBLY_ACC=CAM_ASM_000446 /LENGTH=349 /DNA_ID=CAMNT_0042122019 /DNA_START=416 /DNA_END=1465 /DNA_ORIENTATION=-